MSTQHTPGPWHDLLRSGPLSTLITAADGKRIGAVTSSNEADARLIAAAPELLAALRASTQLLAAFAANGSDELPDVGFSYDLFAIVEACDAAIAKTEKST